MKTLNRTILFIYAIFIIVVLFVIMVLPLDIKNIIGIEEIVDILRNMRGNYIYSLVSAIFLILGILHLISLFRVKDTIKPGSYLVLRNDYGEILIYQDTVIGLVNSVATKFTGINNIKTKVIFVEGNISLSLKGETGSEVNIPDTSMDLQIKVKEHVEKATGAQVNDIKVEIVNTTPVTSRS